MSLVVARVSVGEKSRFLQSVHWLSPYAGVMSKKRIVATSKVIHAPASEIFDLLADPRKHALIDGSGSIKEPRNAPARLFLGAKFQMDMNMGVGYHVKNKVVAFEENKCIAWHHVAQFVWRYDLQPVEDGTLVTESFNYDKPWGWAIEPFHFPEKNLESMKATLERIEEVTAEKSA